MAGPYDGIHQFLFVRWQDEPGPAAQMAAVRRKFGKPNKDGPLFFADVLGRDEELDPQMGGFAHYAKDTAEELGELQSALWDEGVRSDYHGEGAVYKDASGIAKGPRRHSPTFGVLCRFSVDQRPDSVLKAIGDHWGGEYPFVGASQLLRGSKLLVQLGDEDKETLLRTHLPELLQIPGVVQEGLLLGVIDPGASGA